MPVGPLPPDCAQMSNLIHSFKDDFEALCSETPHQQVLVDPRTGNGWSYGELWDLLNRFSSHLWDAGLRPGDRVSSLLPDSPEQLLAFLTALSFGLEFCPISLNLTPEERRQCLRLCRPAAGLIPTEMDHDIGEELRQSTSKRLLISVPIDGSIGRYISAKRGRVLDSSDHCGKLLLFTSGTTSIPKAIVLNGDRLWSSARACADFHSVLDAAANELYEPIYPSSEGLSTHHCQLSPACVATRVRRDRHRVSSTPPSPP